MFILTLFVMAIDLFPEHFHDFTPGFLFNPLPDRVENFIYFLCRGINANTYKITEITVKNQVQLGHTELVKITKYGVF